MSSAVSHKLFIPTTFVPTQSVAILSLSGRDFVSLRDFTPKELMMILSKSAELKEKLKRGEPHEELRGKSLAMIFEFPSTRTRTSFEVGMQQLGGHALFFSPEHYWTKEREAVSDLGRVMSRYVHGVMIRALNQKDVVELAEWASVPVINACTNYEHPCQVMADFMTTWEKRGHLKGLKTVIAWTYSPYAIPLGIVNSALFAGSKLGMDVTIACPEGYDPDPEVWETSLREAEATNAKISVSRDLKEAVREADVVHIKAWAPHASFTKGVATKPPHARNPKKYKRWKVTEEIVALAKGDVMVQHALPVLRGVQATDGVLDGPNSVIFDEAENRLHVQKGIMSLIMK